MQCTYSSWMHVTIKLLFQPFDGCKVLGLKITIEFNLLNVHV